MSKALCNCKVLLISEALDPEYRSVENRQLSLGPNHDSVTH